ncbi:MAG: CopD family protein [Ilumatobacteraceae bacterium]|nr:CopD family protein [Ilumatobacteraceae bacterium]
MTRLPWALSLFGRILAVSIMVVIALASVASAHSDFEGSQPAADAVLVQPLDSITLRFATTVIGEGSSVVAVAQTSGVATQSELVEESDTNWLAVFTPPLQGDLFRIVYSFRAEDGHLIEGEFALNAVSATTTTTVANDGEGTLEVSEPVETMSTTTEASSTSQPGDIDTGAPPPASGPSSASGTDTANHISRLTQNLLGMTVVGYLVFTIACWRREDILPAPRVSIAVAVVIVLAGLLEIATIGRQLDIAFGDALSHQLSRSPFITTCAAAVLAIAALSVLTGQVRSRSSFRALLVIPCLGLLVAPAFDGHTVSMGPRLLHALSDVVHMGSTSMWIGSVIGLAVVARTDRRQLSAVAQRTATALMGTVAAVVLSGVVMTLIIIDDLSSLTDSTWGRILIVKVVTVLSAGLIGAVHHWRVVPRLASRDVQTTFERSVTIELAALIAVIAVSSWLVVAMP